MTSVSFSIPTERAAAVPPETRGLERDQVRMMVATRDGLEHSVFDQLHQHLLPGDLVVVNNSATLAAAVDAIWEGQDVVAHFSTRLDPATWVIELRQTDGAGPILHANPGDTVEFNGGRGVATLQAPASGTGDGEGTRLWRTRLYLPSTVEKFLGEYGRPIRYDYLSGAWPLRYYQTIFARPDNPSGASAEMPSAGRPFSTNVVNRLIARGVRVAHITLHAGVSSLEHHEPPQPEPYVVPARTAKEVRAAQLRGSRIVAVGTTVTRALETVATPDGSIAPDRGWTELVLGPDRPAQIVDGLITGWHPPQASHLLLLEAVAGGELVDTAYRSALDNGYLWHEFGDSCLFLP